MSFPKTYAVKRHEKKGQTYDGHPYEFHLKEVALIARRERYRLPSYLPERDIEFYRGVFSDATWLHDLLEDTDTTYEDLLIFFDTEAADIVRLVTDPSAPELSRKEKKALMNEQFSKYDINVFEEWAALVLKASDRLANYRYSVTTKNKAKIKMYFKEHLDFKKAVWRENVAVKVWEELDQIDQLVSEQYNFSR